MPPPRLRITRCLRAPSSCHAGCARKPACMHACMHAASRLFREERAGDDCLQARAAGARLPREALPVAVTRR